MSSWNQSRLRGHFCICVCSCSNKACSINQGEKEDAPLKTCDKKETNHQGNCHPWKSRQTRTIAGFQNKHIVLTDFDNKLQLLLIEALVRLAYDKQRSEEFYNQLWSNYIRTFSSFQHACEIHYLEKLIDSVSACILENLLQEHLSKNRNILGHMHSYNTKQIVHFSNPLSNPKSEPSARELHKVCVILNHTEGLSAIVPQTNQENFFISKKKINDCRQESIPTMHSSTLTVEEKWKTMSCLSSTYGEIPEARTGESVGVSQSNSRHSKDASPLRIQERDNTPTVVTEESYPLVYSRENTMNTFSSSPLKEKEEIFYGPNHCMFDKPFENDKTCDKTDVFSLISSSPPWSCSSSHGLDYHTLKNLKHETKETYASADWVSKKQTPLVQSFSTNSDSFHPRRSSRLTFNSKESILHDAPVPLSILDSFYSMFDTSNRAIPQTEPNINLDLKTWCLHDCHETSTKKVFNLPNNIHYAYALRCSNITVMASTCVEYFVFESCITADATIQDILNSLHLKHSSDMALTIEGYCSCIYLLECHNVKLVLKSGSRYATFYTQGCSNIQLYATKVSSQGCFLMDEDPLQLTLPEENTFQLDLQTLTLHLKPFENPASFNIAEMSRTCSSDPSYEETFEGRPHMSLQQNNTRDSSNVTTNETLASYQEGSISSSQVFADQETNDRMEDQISDVESYSHQSSSHCSIDRSGNDLTNTSRESGTVQQAVDSDSPLNHVHSSLEVEHKPFTTSSCNGLDTEENNLKNFTTFCCLNKNIIKSTSDLNNSSRNISRPPCTTLSLKKHAAQSLQCVFKNSSLHTTTGTIRKSVQKMGAASQDYLLNTIWGHQISETQPFLMNKDSRHDKHLQNTKLENVLQVSNSILCSYASQHHERNARTVASQSCCLSYKNVTPSVHLPSKNVVLFWEKNIHHNESTETSQFMLANKKTQSFLSFPSRLLTKRVPVTKNDANMNDSSIIIINKVTKQFTKNFIRPSLNGKHNISLSRSSLPFESVLPFLCHSRLNTAGKDKKTDAISCQQVARFKSIKSRHSSPFPLQQDFKKKSLSQCSSETNYGIHSFIVPAYAFSKILPVTNVLCTFSSPSVQSIDNDASVLPYFSTTLHQQLPEKDKKNIFSTSTLCTPTNGVTPLSFSLLTSSFKTSFLAPHSFQKKPLRKVSSLVVQGKVNGTSNVSKKKSQRNRSAHVIQQQSNKRYIAFKNDSSMCHFQLASLISSSSKPLMDYKRKHTKKLTQPLSLESVLYRSKTTHALWNTDESPRIPKNLRIYSFCKENQGFHALPAHDSQQLQLTRKKSSNYHFRYKHVDFNKHHPQVSRTLACYSDPISPECHLTNGFIKPFFIKKTSKRLTNSIKIGSLNVAKLLSSHQREPPFLPSKMVSLGFNPFAIQLYKETYLVKSSKTPHTFSSTPQVEWPRFPTKLTPLKTFNAWIVPQHLPTIFLKKKIIPTNTNFSTNKVLVHYKKKNRDRFENNTLIKIKIKHDALDYFKKAIRPNVISTKNQFTSVISISPPILKTITGDAFQFESFSMKQIRPDSNDVISPKKSKPKVFNCIDRHQNQLYSYTKKYSNVGKSNNKDTSFVLLKPKIFKQKAQIKSTVVCLPQKNISFNTNCTTSTQIPSHKFCALKLPVMNPTMQNAFKPTQVVRQVALLNSGKHNLVSNPQFHKRTSISSHSQCQKSRTSLKDFMNHLETNSGDIENSNSCSASSTKDDNCVSHKSHQTDIPLKTDGTVQPTSVRNSDYPNEMKYDHSLPSSLNDVRPKCSLPKGKVAPKVSPNSSVLLNCVNNLTINEKEQVSELTQVKYTTSDGFYKNKTHALNVKTIQSLCHPKIILKVHPKISRFEKNKFHKR
ncbi:uncharacterized protein LOC128883290 isoform X2 [Hylaeus volcanicus]|uniref:uncharacterized protein LOC128883290 isoform X2 n=1 Tax=Hylaeus volcanicus TaxID=313075 RepID=UPI0023B816AA|nr:uncharacterized protein LOC128883290 isoform X2 [Hylaeus volcanicus]